MRRNIKISAPVLTEPDARCVKGMLARGDRQHDIAAWFGVNGGRVAEIANGSRFWWVIASDACDLPPRGPYPGAAALAIATKALIEARAALAAAEAALASGE